MTVPFGHGAAAPDTTLVQALSPRVARVRNLRNEMLYCKRLEPAHADMPEATELLRREAQVLQAVARSSARGRVPTIVGQGHDTSGPYLLLAPLQGSPISAAALPVEGAPAHARTLFAALADLHSAKTDGAALELVHGDISPENALYMDNTAAFVDWELGRCAGVPDLALGPFRGTLAFVAPEVASGSPPSQASDVFALGMTLLQVLLGSPLRKQHGAAGLLEAAETPVDLDAIFSARADGRIASLRSFFAAVLAHSPEERPRDGGAALALL